MAWPGLHRDALAWAAVTRLRIWRDFAMIPRRAPPVPPPTCRSYEAAGRGSAVEFGNSKQIVSFIYSRLNPGHRPNAKKIVLSRKIGLAGLRRTA